MRASILVTASPYTATTAEDGSFSITNVKPGQYNLTVYAGPAPIVRPIDVKSGPTDLGLIQQTGGWEIRRSLLKRISPTLLT
jgi:hypothetical protein